MSRIRILYLTSESHPTFRADVDALFGKYLPREGVFSDLVTSQSSQYNGEPWGGGRVVLCSRPKRGIQAHVIKFFHSFRSVFFADKAVYTAVQVRDMPFIGLLALCLSRIRGIPFLYWASYPIPESQMVRAEKTRKNKGFIRFLGLWLRGWFGRWVLYRLVLRGASHIFVQSERMREDFARLGVDVEKMTPVPMGVDLEALGKVGQCAQLPALDSQSGRLLVHLGTLERTRNIEVLFEMLALVKARVPEAKLLLVGDTRDPAHRSWLQERAEEAGVSDSVIWTGWVTMNEAWQYVRQAEVGLSPFPRGELLDSASPTKVPEYLALGVPVVCNDNPDQERAVRESQAGICVPYTAKAFAEAVEQLLIAPEASRAQRKAAGLDYVKKHRDYAVLAAQLARAYQKAFSCL